MTQGTRLIPITARAVPDHKLVRVIVARPHVLLDYAPDEARRLAHELLRAAHDAEIPPPGRNGKVRP